MFRSFSTPEREVPKTAEVLKVLTTSNPTYAPPPFIVPCIATHYELPAFDCVGPILSGSLFVRAF